VEVQIVHISVLTMMLFEIWPGVGVAVLLALSTPILTEDIAKNDKSGAGDTISLSSTASSATSTDKCVEGEPIQINA